MIVFLKRLKDVFRSTFWVNDVEFIRETDKAYLLKFCYQKQWYPKSKVYDVDKKNNRIKVDSFWETKFI